jgi:adenylate kinase
MSFFKENSILFLYLTTGSEFRALGKENYSLSLMKKLMDQGSLVPDFLATGLVVNTLIRNISESQNLIFNGFPRTTKQGKQFVQIMDFYGRKPKIIFIRTHVKLVIERMEIRKGIEDRPDDTREAITERFKVFRKENTPLIHFLKAHFESIEIDGSGTPEEVHKRILEALGFNKTALI